MMKEVDRDDDEVVSLLDDEKKNKNSSPCCGWVRRPFVATKAFYFFFFSAQGSLMPYLALYYKQLRLSAAEAGLVSGTKMYVAFLVIPLWGMLVDKFNVGKLVFVMSTTALIATMLTISMAPASICGTNHEKLKRSILASGYSSFNDTMSSKYIIDETNKKLVAEDKNSGTNFERTASILFPKVPPLNHFDLFLFLLIVTVLGTVFSCPCLSLADSATVDLLVRNGESHNYGKQRLWGSVGNGLAAFIVGASISQTNLCPGEEREVDYYWCFYSFAFFLFLALVAGSRLQYNSGTDTTLSSGSTRLLGSLREVLFNVNYLVFLFTVFFDGVAMSFIKAFLFWYLKDLGGNQFLFSVISAVNCSMEVLMYFLSAYLIKRMGSIRVLCIGLLCYAIRFCFYTFVKRPWLVLVVEPLSGITTAAFWAAIMSHVGVTAVKDSAVTLQGVIHCIHWGLGHGSGQVLGGLLVHSIGARNTFAIFAFTSVFNLVAYLLVLNYSRRKRVQES